MELATGKFPYDSWGSPFEQLKQVVKDDPPRLPSGIFTSQFEDFICLWLVLLIFFTHFKCVYYLLCLMHKNDLF